ncbi:SpvB/TcaC N-terminal domain-containing protein [Lewinella sp. W8]|uniref:SpvB/TcaC N-terminal domain-containing protein n=1 Tax=Lewinella sp. W8 TaxID=2528208 RepID=UPI001067B9DC|nr:SpvB/TcaC N-terminal domain-containing protein [Lewinella sp. W8]MTB53445.1 hypothetical protein [Lewinella sp. W8]
MESSSPLGSSQQTDRHQGMASSFVGDGQQQPKISLPKGGGAIQGVGEKFRVNPVTGTGQLTVPLAISPGRAGFTPELSLSYDSGTGNSVFGLGWSIGLPSVARKTQKGLPRYQDEEESDVFLLSGAEDLVPVLEDEAPLPVVDGYTVKRYRPRIEGLFARIEKWTAAEGTTFWRSISKENVTTVYGRSASARIASPEDETKVFEWLMEYCYDDKGNVMYYRYKPEDQKKVDTTLGHEKNRSAPTNRYLKRVYYGNKVPYLNEGLTAEPPTHNEWNKPNSWLFELVFDYGEHLSGEESNAEEAPTYEEQQPWSCRPDPFSSFRSGFDIRTYRLCRRVLMYHHFEKELDAKDYLVRSTDLKYDQNEMATKLIAVTHTSYRKKGETYEKADFPPLKFTYSKAETRTKPPLLPLTIEDIKTDYPVGKLINQNEAQFVDYDGNGVSDILLKKNGGWYWAENKGNGQFAKLATVPDLPSLANPQRTAGQLVDIDGDGQLEYEVHSPQVKGYFARTEEGRWNKLRHFDHQPNINFQAPDLRRIDLTGDGIPDLLITEQDHLVYYPSEGKVGYGAAQRIAKALDETKGPQIVFSNPEQSIYLADMTGDGLTDIVRIRKDNICYWANMGYARFSPKVEMENCPKFDTNDQFNQRYIKLADIDGSGTTDIIYLGGEQIQFWHNEAGNSWRDPVPINIPLPIDSLTTVQVIDFLAKGTAQLVWSSPVPSHQESPLRYVDLMPEKPHLLIGIHNNRGAEIRLTYQPSTDFYLADKAAGKPWITKLPFPVLVLTRQETYDHISKNSFVTRYAYHHGYYDRAEREFRGFGLVEQWDTEDFATLRKDEAYTPPGSNWSEVTDVPPIYTKTWFHTGHYYLPDHTRTPYRAEYFRERDEAGEPTHADWPLEDSAFPPDLSTEEQREACRALKGQLLRQEVYADDGTERAGLPYTVTSNNYQLKRLQARGENRHAVFFAAPQESLTYHYERDMADPRVAHKLPVNTLGK